MWDQIYYVYINNKPQVIFFLVFMVAAVPVLYYYKRRNPNPRFRPNAGEMTLVSLFAIIICAAMGVGLGTVFNKEQEFRKLGGKPAVELPVGDAGYTKGKAGPEQEKKEEQGVPIEVILQQGKGR